MHHIDSLANETSKMITVFVSFAPGHCWGVDAWSSLFALALNHNQTTSGMRGMHLHKHRIICLHMQWHSSDDGVVCVQWTTLQSMLFASKVTGLPEVCFLGCSYGFV